MFTDNIFFLYAGILFIPTVLIITALVVYLLKRFRPRGDKNTNKTKWDKEFIERRKNPDSTYSYYRVWEVKWSPPNSQDEE